MADFKLQAVQCKNCGSGLVVELNDNITYCSSCGSGFEINQDVFTPIEINFASASIRQEGEIVYKPFWFLKTNVNILTRDTSGGFVSKLFGSKEKPSGEIIFYIPAFSCSVEVMKNLAQAFTVKNPVASPQKSNAKITGFAYGKEDAKKLAEFILISIEAEKSDTIKNLEYEIDFKSCEILGIPFYKGSEGHLTDAILGMKL